ncbi:MAG: hypothetical protein JST13_01370 [Bacteroidetes bacterium]|nr:hypothetical protein [Bacteroidota bacterium]
MLFSAGVCTLVIGARAYIAKTTKTCPFNAMLDQEKTFMLIIQNGVFLRVTRVAPPKKLKPPKFGSFLSSVIPNC